MQLHLGSRSAADSEGTPSTVDGLSHAQNVRVFSLHMLNLDQRAEGKQSSYGTEQNLQLILCHCRPESHIDL